MSGLNKVQLIGHLGKDPELRHTQNNMQICKFSLATTEQVPSGNGERKDKTAWHNITIFGKQAEVASRYLKKGRQVYLEGRLDYGSYVDKQGIKRYTTDIIVHKLVFLGSNDSQPNAGYSSSTPPQTSTNYTPESDQFEDSENIPF